MTRQVKVNGRKIKTHGIPTWVYAEGVDNIYPEYVADYKNDHYFSDYLEKSFSDEQIYTRTGVTWAWQMVGGNLELVEIADGMAPFSVHPVTGLDIGVDVFPNVTRKNLRYMPTASDILALGGTTLADSANNTLGHFAGVRILSGGATSDSSRTKVVDNASLTATFKYGMDFIVQDDDESTIIQLGFRANATGLNSRIEYTFASKNASIFSEDAGTFADIVVTELLDGSHRIVGEFVPNATDDYAAMLNPLHAVAGEGFTLSAWFLTYWGLQTHRTPPPVLGAQGAEYTHGSDGLLHFNHTVIGDHTIVAIKRTIFVNSNWDSHFDYRGTNIATIASVQHVERDAIGINDKQGVFSNFYMRDLAYGERTALGVVVNNTAQIYCHYNDTWGLKTVLGSAIMNLGDPIIFGVGCEVNSGLGFVRTPLGNTTEKILIFNTALTQVQIEEIVQRGF